MTRGVATAAALTAILLAGCGAGSSDQSVTVGDSAGVRIVESPASAAERPLDWTIAVEPELDIGAGDDSLYQFHRIAGAQQLPGGGVAVADMGARLLRFYDAGGQYVRTQGGPGEGPGEYAFLSLLRSDAADTIVVFDMSQRRLTFVDATGELVRVESFAASGGFGQPIARLPDGRWLTQGNTATVGPGDEEAIVTNEVVVGIRAADGARVDTVARLHGPELLRWWMSERQPAFTPVPFSIAPSIAAAPGGAFVTLSGPHAAVLGHDATGRIAAIFRVAGDPEPLDRSEFDAVAESRAGEAPEDLRQRVRDAYGNMPVPALRPAFDQVIVDAGGNTWVRRFTTMVDGPRKWVVFAADGSALGTIATPARFEVLEIGDDYLLGRWRDELDVQHLRRYALIKP